MTSESLLTLIQSLPAPYESQVEAFIKDLLAGQQEKKTNKLRQSWAGGLSDASDTWSSVSLQKKALDWWIE